MLSEATQLARDLTRSESGQSGTKHTICPCRRRKGLVLSDLKSHSRSKNGPRKSPTTDADQIHEIDGERSTVACDKVRLLSFVKKELDLVGERELEKSLEITM
ncbi:hypothetical protein HAX54_003006 [Datura stramonium]|uniref:Uncharacterized protein n=1 Tax=Datura stramonium TaxID=4076 RepID=A0ABS8T5H6_DATST|nr:hypothetical protein [Datura stramonium]